MNHTTIKLLKVDLLYGLFGESKKRILVVLCAIILSYFFSISRVIIQLPVEYHHITFFESLFCLHLGMAEYIPRDGIPFTIPIEWLGMVISFIYLVSEYPERSLRRIGSQVLLRLPTRWSWWISKLLWICCCSFMCWLLSILVALGGTIVLGGSFELSLRPEIAAIYGIGDISKSNFRPRDLSLILICILSALNALMLFGHVLAILVRPFVGFITVVFLLFLSSYYLSNWLIGNYLMTARFDLFISNGVNPVIGIILSIGLCLMIATAGGWFFVKSNLLNKADANDYDF